MGNESEPSTLPFDLPEMRTHWECKPLSELIDPSRSISYGIVQPGRYDPSGIPIVRVNNIRYGRIQETDLKKVTPSIESAYTRTRLKGGELLLTLVGTLGEVAIVPQHIAGWNIARAVGLILVDMDIGADWVALCLRSNHAQHFIRTRATTTVQATFNLRDVGQIPIPLPPKTEREAIVHILGSLDDKIELNRQMNRTLEKMAQAIFKSWFIDFDPVRAKAEGRDPGLPKEIAALFPDSFEDSELGEIPKGWKVGALGEIAENPRRGVKPDEVPPQPHTLAFSTCQGAVLLWINGVALTRLAAKNHNLEEASFSLVNFVRTSTKWGLHRLMVFARQTFLWWFLKPSTGAVTRSFWFPAKRSLIIQIHTRLERECPEQIGKI